MSTSSVNSGLSTPLDQPNTRPSKRSLSVNTLYFPLGECPCVFDKVTELPVLIYTRASFSIFPLTPSMKVLHSSQELLNIRGITGQSLSATSRGVYNLDVGFNSVLTREFVVAPLPLKGIIMGADILNEYQLKIYFCINGIIRKDKVVTFRTFYLKHYCQSSQFLRSILRKNRWRERKI